MRSIFELYAFCLTPLAKLLLLALALVRVPVVKYASMLQQILEPCIRSTAAEYFLHLLEIVRYCPSREGKYQPFTETEIVLPRDCGILFCISPISSGSGSSSSANSE